MVDDTKKENKKSNQVVKFISTTTMIFIGLMLFTLVSRVLSPEYSDSAYLAGYYGGIFSVLCCVSVFIAGGILIFKKLVSRG